MQMITLNATIWYQKNHKPQRGFMNGVRYTEIDSEEDGQRLDNYLLRLLKGVPKSHVYRLIRNGEVRLNKKRARVSSRVRTGDSVRIPPIRLGEAKKDLHVGSRLIQLLHESIIHEDAQLLVVNKPAGIAVHGGSGLSLGLIEALRKIRPDLAYLELVHRLDKDTSGCLLLAKKRSVLRAIQALLASRNVEKTYWALLAHPWQGKGSLTVNLALEKRIQGGERLVMVNDEGKASRTDFKLLENFQEACWVEARPKTGRTHQIRVHSAYLNHPIVGDVKYGGDIPISGLEAMPKRLYLHAKEVCFYLQDKHYSFQADVDARFKESLEALRQC